MGISSQIKNELGSLIGSSEVRVLEIAKLYSIFANSGKLIEPIVIKEIRDKNNEIIYKAEPLEERSTQVLSERINHLIKEGLRNVFLYGTAQNYKNLAKDGFGKTGTTNNSKDNWFAGSYKKYTTVVWLGSESIYSLPKEIESATFALPLWAKLVKDYEDYENIKETKLNHMLIKNIDPNHGYTTPSGIKMWFLEENQPNKNNSYLKSIKKNKIKYEIVNYCDYFNKKKITLFIFFYVLAA